MLLTGCTSNICSVPAPFFSLFLRAPIQIWSLISSASLISIPGQSPHWINRWTGILIQYPCVFVAYPSSPIYRWSNRGNGPTMLGLLLNHRGKISMNNLRLSWPKNGLAKDFTTWNRMRGPCYWNDLEIWLMWNAHFFCVWMSHVYHCLSRFSHASLQFLG